jgi:hypothetical protein
MAPRILEKFQAAGCWWLKAIDLKVASPQATA